MTLKARVDKLEGALSPRAATLAWLHEAHAFGSIDAYADSPADQPVSAYPLDCVPARAAAAAAAAARGQPREVVAETRRKAGRDAVFLVKLVFEINAESETATQLGRLRDVTLTEQMRCLVLEEELATHDPTEFGASCCCEGQEMTGLGISSAD
jgi:hypothetical protein